MLILRRIRSLALIGLLSAGIFSVGCESDAQSGALFGAGLGALAGQAIGGDTEATVIGTAIGAGAGYAIGNESDKKRYHRGGGGNYNYYRHGGYDHYDRPRRRCDYDY